MTKPYFYIIQFKQTKQLYAGVRYANGCAPEELLTEDGYKTSSNVVNKLINEHGLDAFQIKEIKTFDTTNEAIEYEQEYLTKVDAAKSPEYLNLSNTGLGDFNTENLNSVLTDRYGVKWPSHIPGHWGKLKKTSLERYGTDHPLKSREVINKRIETNIKRYGTPYPTQTDEVKAKTKNTVVEKYNANSMVESEYFKNKREETMLKKYGTTNYSSTDEFKRVASEKQLGSKHHRFKGWFVTPHGKFGSSREAARVIDLIDRKVVNRWCKNPQTKISKGSYTKNEYLNSTYDESIIGQTVASLGFSYEPI